ncbi:MAG: PGF-pre-PGF domain-containing protein, partial [Candidatus Aenigmarchaeota archaeon]
TLENMNTTAMLYFTIDRTAPAIYNVSNGTAYWNSMRISWNTNEPGNSSVLYGTSPGALSLGKTNSSLATSHDLSLTGLSGSTTYYYNVSSCDSAGNCNTSGVYNFTTPACIESWVYGGWSMCAGNLQTRTATDLNGCGTTVNRSIVSQACFIGGGGGPSGGAPPSITYAWDEITPEETATLNIEEEDISLTRIDFQVNEQVSNVNIEVTKLDTKPAEIAQDVAGDVYQYINISHTVNVNQTNVKGVTIGFRVNKTWIAGNDIDKSTVRLNRYVSNNWVGLNTWLVNETTDYINYESLSPGFSYFAVTGEEVGETGREENVTQPPLVCDPGSERCSGNEIQECNPAGTAWVGKESCVHGCDSETLVCNPLPVGGDVSWYVFVVSLLVIAVAGAVYFVSKKKVKSRKKGKKRR